ncbi:hypothetical protein KGP26_29765 (plasmid) [Serratia sp. JSRIV002]|uniref:hypothetical protein n=1 Tax=Serratia sp. JSRIV002 TaxID=2831894 RepID=UPI001CBFE2A2|nr:hypothetical protein [Serratia sp. JSRIV002]UAN54737.1 hypothetical protein KGP26_29765 [Serratia sp. JSRIV002]
MAKATKYFVIDANGVEHTRGSARIYTHAVLFRTNQDARRAGVNSKANRDQIAKNWRFTAECIAKGNPYNDSEKLLAEYRERVAMGCEAWVESVVVAEIARINKDGTGSLSDDWRCAGWCGRHDLAVKLMAKYSQYGHCVIVEAQAK